MELERALPRRLLLVAGAPLLAQSFYNGGSKQIEEGPLRAGEAVGRVYDAGGAALSGARVQVLGGATKRIFHDIRTDSRGHFALPDLPIGRYRMGVSFEGYHLHLWDLDIVRNGVSRNLTIRLQRADR